MKTSTAVIGIFLAGCLLATGCVHHHHHSQPVVVEPATTAGVPAGGPVGSDPAVDMFYNDLAPYGEWVYVDGPGWVWSPYDVEADWRPYQYGHWVYTDYGWTWASDEEYGWAVYHYGRWHQAPRYGWVWVPGSEWGPAWVAWHESDAWVGWAPLPYHVRWRAGVGLDWGNGSMYVSIQSGHWSFVATRHLVEPEVYRHVAPRARNTTYINVTRNVTNYTYVDNRVVNNSVHVKNVGRAVGHPVSKHHVRHADNPGRTRGGRDDGDDLVIYRPREHPGREPQRRPVPPGHDDEHQGKKDQQGKKNSQGQPNGKGKNDRDERPAADRPDRREKPEASRATDPSTRPQRHRPEADRHEVADPDRGHNDNGRKARPVDADERTPKSTSPVDRSHGRDQKNQLQAAPRPTSEPRDDARPAASDVQRPGTKKTQPAASQPTRSQSKSSKDPAAGGGKSKGNDAKSSKSKGSDSKGGGSKSDAAKSGKSKQADPEMEEEESKKKGSKKHD